MHTLLAVVILLACLPLVAFAADPSKNETALTINLANQGKPFRGWGTSLAWWAHGIGDWPQQTLDQIVHLVTDPKDGLGLNVFRYNIGGGDQPGHHHMRQWADVPGFKPSSGAPYDWTADAAQRRVLLALVKATPDRAILEAFSNCAPWWMTVSNCAAGAANGGANLKPQFEQQFADYLTDVVQFYQEQHGLTFDTLEPLNEPDVNWWKANGNQEGMHVPRDQQARLIRLCRAALDKRGLRTTLISATDANSIDDCLTSLRSFDQPTLTVLGQVNTHSYFGNKRAELRQAAAQRAKPLWQSESGPLHVGGTDYEQIMKVAQRIVLDMNQLRPEVWCTWQVVTATPWGCLNEDAQNKTFRIGKKFYMLAAFTRHIRPGDRFVHLDSDRVLAAVSPSRHETTLVLVNRDKSEHLFRLTLAGAGGPPLPATAIGHRTSPTEDLAPIPPIPLHANRLETTLPPESILCLTLDQTP